MSTQYRRTHDAIRIALSWTAVLVLCGSFAFAESPDCNEQPFWLISTRGVSPCRDVADGFRNVRFWQLEDGCRWASEDVARLRGNSGDDVPMVIFVHGSRTDADTAVERGFRVYQTLQQVAKGRSFRCAVWSWPSDRELLRPRPDMQRKMAYCDVQSRYLARFLTELNNPTPVCLIGHSFGARIIAGALHEMAAADRTGSCSPSETAENPPIQRRPLRAMLLAAAIDSNAFASGHRYGSALSIVDQLMVTQNVCDRVLRWYPRIYGRGGPQAMGAIGPGLNTGAEKVEVVDVSGSVGKLHDVRCHLASGEFHSRLARYVFSDGDGSAETPAKP